MAKERLKSPRVRLFIALDLPSGARAAIDAWGREELADPALRPVSPVSLHVTLVFLGYRPEKEVDRLAEIVGAIDAPAPQAELRDPVARPERGRPRLYAIPVESSGIVKLREDLVARLAAEGLYEPEKRPFWPHLTVARVRPEKRGPRHPKQVTSPPGALTRPLSRPVRCVRVALYRSELKPQGAEYTPLAQIDLR